MSHAAWRATNDKVTESTAVDDHTMQAFLSEGVGIIEQLDQQLVTLGSGADDGRALLDATHGFHRIGGHAAELGIDELAALSGKAEGLCRALADGARDVDAEIATLFVQVLRALRRMFEGLAEGRVAAVPADELMARLLVHAEVAQSDPAGAAVEHTRQLAPCPRAAEGDVFAVGELFDVTDPGTRVPAGDEALMARIVDEIKAASERETSYDDLQAQAGDAFAALCASAAAETGLFDVTGGDTPPLTPTIRRTSGASAAPAGLPDADPTPPLLDDRLAALARVRDRLSTLAADRDDAELSDTATDLARVAGALQEAAMPGEAQPLAGLFARAARVAAPLARQLGREVELELDPGTAAVERNLLEALATPLATLLGNAVRHGIELPAVRRDAGKPAAGRIGLSARCAAQRVVLTVTDDGRGINLDAVRREAVANGLLSAAAAARLPARDCLDLLLLPGLRPAGAGAASGLARLHRWARRLGGTLTLDSAAGHGASVTLELPLVAANLPLLMVRRGAHRFALPQAEVDQILPAQRARTRALNGRELLFNGGRAFDLLDPSYWFGDEAVAARSGDSRVVIVRAGEDSAAFVVDKVDGVRELALRPLGAIACGAAGVAGVVVDAGEFVTVAEPAALAAACAGR